MTRSLDFILIAIFTLSAGALLLTHEDPFLRDMVCNKIGLCPEISHSKAWNKIVYDLAAGTLITLIFYLLLVRLPDYQRRQRLKDGLRRHYKSFRIDCIEIMLLVADGSYSSDLPKKLLTQSQFRDYFKENIASDRNRWDEFHNKLSENYLRELLTRMEIFRDEITYILNNTDIPKDEPFELLKRLSAAIYSMKHVTVGDERPLSQFLWTMFAGWDWTTGYQKEDIVEKMIEAI